jgi:hypothetical protein
MRKERDFSDALTFLEKRPTFKQYATADVSHVPVVAQDSAHDGLGLGYFFGYFFW